MNDTQDPHEAESQNVLEQPKAESGLSKSEDETHQSPLLQEMLVLIEAQPDPEAKLTLAIGFMARALAQSGSPQLQTFWALRRLCQTFFKESISQNVRIKLWTHYRELIEEGRKLKEMLDEQSAFAAEQIEIAVKSLEDELSQLPNIPNVQQFSQPVFPSSLKKNEQNYCKFQQELDFLNVSASRINAMRKELIKTEMRTGQKNKFFHRLSAAGDRVFPRRKELIKEVSQLFMADVNAFINSVGLDEKQGSSLSFIRNEIKALQSIAKSLTLNTQCFNKTRLQLSECWDKVKETEKEIKRESAQKRTASKEKAQELQGQIQTVKESFERGELSTDNAQKQLEEYATIFRTLELDRSDVQSLKESLRQARQLVLDRIRLTEQERRQKGQEREQQRLSQVETIHKKLEELLESDESVSSERLMEGQSALLPQLEADFLTREERLELEQKAKALRDHILDAREKELLSLSSDDDETLEKLHEALEERLDRRKAILEQLELLRKEAGSSGRDFTQAMLLNAQQEEERAHLARTEQRIADIEDRIEEIEERIS